MRDWEAQSHVKWYCRYHVVWIPKYRKRILYGKLRRAVGKIIRELCQQYEVEIIQAHAMPDHIHMFIRRRLRAA